MRMSHYYYYLFVFVYLFSAGSQEKIWRPWEGVREREATNPIIFINIIIIIVWEGVLYDCCDGCCHCGAQGNRGDSLTSLLYIHFFHITIMNVFTNSDWHSNLHIYAALDEFYVPCNHTAYVRVYKIVCHTTKWAIDTRRLSSLLSWMLW